MPNSLPTRVDASASTAVAHETVPLGDTLIQQKYDSLATVATPEGWELQAYLGAPLGDPTVTAAGGRVQTYERGAIIIRKDGRAFVVYGEIYAGYHRLGGVSGFLGLPLSDVAPASGGGYGATFDGGEIVWSEATGAHEIHGAIRDRWIALGAGGGVLGYPTSDESVVLRAGIDVGRFNSFQNGAGIYWTAATGAYDVYGAIAGLWQGTYGGPTGALGFPRSGETNTPDPGGRYNEFEHGIVVWRPSGDYAGAFAFFDLSCFLDHFESDWGSYHVEVKVDATNPSSAHDAWYPSVSDYASNPSVSERFVIASPLTAATTVDVWMDGLGQHNFGIGADERLGVYEKRYDITNLWGTRDDPSHAANQNVDPDHHINFIFSLQSPPPLDPNAPFREQCFWPFGNPNTPEMSDATYAQTFTDVHEDESTLWHPFDALFYQIYKGIGKSGDCFGMCLEALYAFYGRSDFAEPIYTNPLYRAALTTGHSVPDPVTFPGDASIMNPIDIKHGYQLGDRFIGYFLEEFVAGHTHDPEDAFKRSRAAFAAGDRPIISVMQDASVGTSGHALLPYRWDDSDPARWTIYVANPNSPYGLQPNDAAPTCTIVVNPAPANTFSVQISEGGSTWTGGSSSGGRMFHIPFSVLNSEPATPIDDVLALIASGAYIILGGDGRTTQITDEGGRTFFGTTGAARIPNFTNVPLVSGLPVESSAQTEGLTNAVDRVVGPAVRLARDVAEMYHLRRPPAFKSVAPAAGANDAQRAEVVNRAPVARPVEALLGADAALTFEVRGVAGSSYTWGVRSPAGSAVVTVPGSDDASGDVIALANAARSLPAVTLRAGGSASKTAAVTLVGPVVTGSERTRLFEVSGVPIAAGPGVTLQLDPTGNELVVVNTGTAATLSIRMQSGSDAANAVTRAAVLLDAGTVHSIAPADWAATALASAPVTLKQLDKIGGTVLKRTQL